MSAHPSLNPEVQRQRQREFDAAVSAQDIARLQARWDLEDEQAVQGKDHRERELADLRARVARIEAVLGPGGRTLCDSWARVTGDVLRTVRREEREFTIAEIEKRQAGMRYAGVWHAERDYQQGDLVTRDGAAWIAVDAVSKGLRPGDGETGWRLAVKSPAAEMKALVKDEVRRQLGKAPGCA